jgi:hypothetical protein
MLLVVVLEGSCHVTQRRSSIRLGHVRHVVTLDRLHEALGQPAGFSLYEAAIKRKAEVIHTWRP